FLFRRGARDLLGTAKRYVADSGFKDIAPGDAGVRLGNVLDRIVPGRIAESRERWRVGAGILIFSRKGTQGTQSNKVFFCVFLRLFSSIALNRQRIRHLTSAATIISVTRRFDLLPAHLRSEEHT